MLYQLSYARVKGKSSGVLFAVKRRSGPVGSLATRALGALRAPCYERFAFDPRCSGVRGPRPQTGRLRPHPITLPAQDPKRQTGGPLAPGRPYVAVR